MSNDIAISVRGLSKAYTLAHDEVRHSTLAETLLDRVRRPFARKKTETFWALQDVSFDIKRGDVVGVIGRNGAGKSTLLKVLSQITEPSSGEVHLYGRVGSLLEVGTGFHPELTGRENIFLNGAILGMSRAEIRAQFDAIVDFSGVEQFLDTPVKRFSSGMYVRLAFAVAAHLDLEILVVDEVLAVGDLDFQKKCIGKMQDVSAKEGRTVLFVSHSMAAISTLTHSAAFMESGRVRYFGPTHDAMACYLSSGKGEPGKYLAQKDDASRDPFIASVECLCLRAPAKHISGDPLEIALVLHHETPLQGACVSFQIVNQFQQPVIHCWLFDAETPICRTKKQTRLVCRIPELKLNVGLYSLNVYFSEPPGGAVFEVLQGICEFEVTILGKQVLFGWRPESCAYLEDFAWTTESIA